MMTGLQIRTQGSFATGGRRGESSDLTYLDTAYVQFQIPQDVRTLPAILWHGGAQSGRCWESTPDGRDGLLTHLVRNGTPVYVIDQPRRGRAGPTNDPQSTSLASPEFFFELFRLGRWPNQFVGSKFPPGEGPLKQFMAQLSAPTAPPDEEREIEAVLDLLARIGPAVLITHSASGQLGFKVTARTQLVRGAVAIEPGANLFHAAGARLPHDNGAMETLPEAIRWHLMPSEMDTSTLRAISQCPTTVIVGDFIPTSKSTHWSSEYWRMRANIVRAFYEAMVALDGSWTWCELADIGLPGHSHFPFSDVENEGVVDEILRSILQYGAKE